MKRDLKTDFRVGPVARLPQAKRTRGEGELREMSRFLSSHYAFSKDTAMYNCFQLFSFRSFFNYKIKTVLLWKKFVQPLEPIIVTG